MASITLIRSMPFSLGKQAPLVEKRQNNCPEAVFHDFCRLRLNGPVRHGKRVFIRIDHFVEKLVTNLIELSPSSSVSAIMAAITAPTDPKAVDGLTITSGCPLKSTHNGFEVVISEGKCGLRIFERKFLENGEMKAYAIEILDPMQITLNFHDFDK